MPGVWSSCEQRVHRCRRALDADDAGELSGEAGHPAFQPVAAMAGHGVGERADEAGAVAAEHRHDEVGFHEAEESRADVEMPERIPRAGVISAA